MSAPLIRELETQSESAFALACAAENAYAVGTDEWAGMLHRAAELSHSGILAGITSLTDDEADELEPSITRLEYELFRLWPFWKDKSASTRWFDA